MPGNADELLVDRRDQLVLRVIRAVPLAVRLESDVELGIEESCRIGAGVVAAVLRRDDRHFGKALRESSRICGTIFDDSSNEIVYGIVARTHSAPSSSFGMNSPPRVYAMPSDTTKSTSDADDRRAAMREAPVEARRVAIADPLERRDSCAPSRRRAVPTTQSTGMTVSVSASEPSSA